MNNKKLLNKTRGCYLSLAFCVGSFGIACGSLLQLPSTAERISLQRGLFLTSLGFVHFISLTEFFNKYFLETKQGFKWRKKYKLMVSDVLDITNKIVSAVQAGFSCIAGFIVCNTTCNKSFLYASNFIMEAYAWFGTAYFMYDIWSMYKVHAHQLAEKFKPAHQKTSIMQAAKKILPYDIITSVAASDKNGHPVRNLKNGDAISSNELNSLGADQHQEKHQRSQTSRWSFFKYLITHPLIVAHHLFIGTFGLLVVTYLRGNIGDCVYSFIFMMEFSTPFVSIRGILSKMGLKNSRIYIWNGLLMLGSFFLCRIVMWPFVFYWYSQALQLPFVQAVEKLPRGCKISIMCLFLPQVYWFYLMCKGACKVFFTSNNKKLISSNNNNKNIENIKTIKSPDMEINGQSNVMKRSTSPTTNKSTKLKNLTQGRSLM